MSKSKQRIILAYCATVCALFAMVQGCTDETGMATRLVERPQQIHLWVGTEFGRDKTEPVGTDQKVFYSGDNIAVGLLVSSEFRDEAYQVFLVNAETGKLIKKLRREIAPEAQAGGQYHKYKVKVLPLAKPQRVIIRAKVGLMTKEALVTLMPKGTPEQVQAVGLPKKPTVEPRKPPVILPKKPTVEPRKPPVRLPKKPTVVARKPSGPTISEQYLFSCNYWKDSNKDGIADYPNEFSGIKNRFRKGDRIILVCWLKGSAIKGKKLITKIYNPKGKEITRNMSTIVSSDDFANMVGEPDADLMDMLFRKGGLGTYKVAWYLDRKIIGMHEFEITE